MISLLELWDLHGFPAIHVRLLDGTFHFQSYCEQMICGGPNWRACFLSDLKPPNQTTIERFAPNLLRWVISEPVFFWENGKLEMKHAITYTPSKRRCFDGTDLYKQIHGPPFDIGDLPWYFDAI